jgi:hypothetical protein
MGTKEEPPVMEEQRNDELSLLAWMNVVLSFLFMVVAVPLLLWLLSLLLAPNWHRLIFSYPFSVGILLICVVLGYGNASRYYRRAKSRLKR